jgi:hypothetical protein
MTNNYDKERKEILDLHEMKIEIEMYFEKAVKETLDK